MCKWQKCTSNYVEWLTDEGEFFNKRQHLFLYSFGDEVGLAVSVCLGHL